MEGGVPPLEEEGKWRGSPGREERGEEESGALR